MTAPLHHLGDARLPLPAGRVHDLLRAAPSELLTAATADALQRCAPLLRAWGATPTALPTVTADALPEEELGSVHVRWTGDDAATGWPAMHAWLVVTPHGPADSRITLLTTRPPSTMFGRQHLDAFHRRQAVGTGVRAFLDSIVAQLQAPPSAPAPVARPAVAVPHAGRSGGAS